MIQWTRKKSLPLSHWVGRVWCRPTRINKKTTEQTCSNYSFSSLIFTSFLFDSSSIKSASTSQILFSCIFLSTTSSTSSFLHRQVSVKNSSISTTETTQSKLPYESRSKFINETTLCAETWRSSPQRQDYSKQPLKRQTTATSPSSEDSNKVQQQEARS